MKLLIGILAFTAGNAWAQTAARPKVTLQADVWCPFNCQPRSDLPGYMVEIAKEAFNSIGTDVDYQTISWARAIALGREGKIAGIIGAATSDAPDFIYPEVPLGEMKNCFYTLPKSTWIFKDVDSLKKAKIGIIKGYTYGKPLDDYVVAWEKEQEDRKKKGSAGAAQAGLGENIQSVPGDKALDLNIKKINADRIDSFVEEQSVLKKYMFTNKIAEGTFKNVGCLEGDNVSIAFGPKEPKGKEYAKLISDTMTAMRKDGRLKKVLEKYGLKDWSK